MKKIISLLVVLAMLMAMVPAVFAATTATITFDDTSKRTSGDNTIQVWEENGITVTNEKANSSTNVNLNYYNPIRCYQGSSLTVAYPEMSQIAVACNTTAYATALQNSISDDAVTVSVDGKVVTITFSSAMNSYTVAQLSAQVRIDSITVTAGELEVCTHPNEAVNKYDANGHWTACPDCGVALSDVVVHTYEDGVCSCGHTAADEYVTAPDSTKTYKWGFYTTSSDYNYGTQYYATGVVNASNYMETTTNIEEAADLYVEEVDGGYNAYFLDGEGKNYVALNSSNKITLVTDAASAALLTWNGSYNTFVTLSGETAYYFGTYNSYNTIGASKLSYVTDSNVDVTQYPARLIDVTPTSADDETATLIDGDNYMELAIDATEPVVFNYTATQTGTLYLAVVNFLYSASNTDGYVDNNSYMDEFADYTFFTIGGQSLEGGYYGSVEVVKGQTYEVVWEHNYDARWVEYGWAVTMNLSYTDEFLPKLGDESTPVELFTTDCPTNTIEIGAGETAYYLLYDFGGTHLTVTGENAYVLLSYFDWSSYSWADERYDAVNGVADVAVPGYYTTIQIGNAGESAATFALDYYFALGTINNPDTLVMGENTASIDSSTYRYIYTWAPDCNGTLTLTIPVGVDGSCNILNLYDENDWGSSYYFSELTDGKIVFEAVAGAKYQITIEAWNPGDVVFTASAVYTHEISVSNTEVVEPTCIDDGLAEYYYCGCCGKLFGDADCTTEISWSDIYIPALGHNTTHVEAKEATCLDEGNVEYWHCETCDGVWLNETCTESTDLTAVVVPVTDHSVVHVEAVEATCLDDGNIEYWYCENCGFAWLDEECTLNTNLMAVILPAKDHAIVHVEAKDATCEENGNIEYWYCEVCGFAWLDEECTRNTNLMAVVLPAGHTVKHVEAKAATCLDEGNIEYWYCTTCGYAWLDEDCTLNTNLKAVILPVTDHSVVHVEAVEATCLDDGNIEYWYCENCGFAWLDEDCTLNTNLMAVILPAKEHTIVHVDAVEATCLDDGNIEYWYCEVCGFAWLDEDCTLNTNLMAVILPAKEHTIVHVEAKNATCEENGNIEYWYCEVCGFAWLDEECTLNTNLMAVVLPSLGHTVTHVEAKDATCEEEGNVEYWCCEVCGCAWLNEAGTESTDLADVALPTTEHNFVDDVCTVCGALAELYYENKAEIDDDFTLTLGENDTVEYVDITEKHTVVLGEDGYYHLDSADGAIVYVDMDHIFNFDEPIKSTTGSGQIYLYVYDENGALVKNENGEYLKYNATDAIQEYLDAADENGYYPLTEDLIYFYQSYGKSQGWYMAGMSWLVTAELIPEDFDPDTAWMFACLTVVTEEAEEPGDTSTDTETPSETPTETPEDTDKEDNTNKGDDSNPKTADTLSVMVAAAVIGVMSIVALPAAKKFF